MSVSRETTLPPMSREQFAQTLSVSRETLERLSAYAELLVKWQAKINLVGPATLPDLWRRHMLDSAQMAAHLPDGPVLDLGSGAGFPGLVLAVMTGQTVHLVESDARKCAFLREAARIAGADVVIHNKRIEAVAPFSVAAVTARALASLDKLLDWAAPFLQQRTQCLFLKGKIVDEELTQAGEHWKMTSRRVPSLSDPSGLILILNEVHRGRDER
ncbi:MAG TPA: 16S rRNA (guanine(527)-N(7))-methyltransferase RsmG [Candidatus Sulfotelmatobacter sp.]|jgi:16S rRNA (guanine527-N7)-methyltransferase|nr:16S rRNA (guanine(527)-N(7))-methyltransferase RsmG [Candidatus Sulfotelmatobacter sp.]